MFALFICGHTSRFKMDRVSNPPCHGNKSIRTVAVLRCGLTFENHGGFRTKNNLKIKVILFGGFKNIFYFYIITKTQDR